MPPKKGGKKKKEPEAPPPPSEFDDKSVADLRRILLELRIETEKLARERNQAQVDRDAIERFFEISKKELREVELAGLSKEREMEVMNDNHRVEVKVYQQKVKHLEYEHGNAIKRVVVEDSATLKAEEIGHLRQEAAMRAEKQVLRARIRETEEANAEAVRAMKAAQEKNITKLRQEFRVNIEQLRAKYEQRLQQLRDDLRLRHKVEVHEVEERKNLHINQLMKAHDDAFAEMKKYYNDITRANLELIAQLKAQVAQATDKQAANQKLMLQVAEESKRLSDPLQRAQEELRALQSDLRDADKDRQSLRYAKARLKTLRAQTEDVQRAHAELEAKYAAAQAERDALYGRFEETVYAAQGRAEAKNEVLERKLAEAEAEFVTKKTQIEEVMAAAHLDAPTMVAISQRLDVLLEKRNRLIRDLQASVGLLTKAHNDAVRVLGARLRDMGVPEAELAYPLLATTAGLGPAGLVTQPAIV